MILKLKYSQQIFEFWLLMNLHVLEYEEYDIIKNSFDFQRFILKVIRKFRGFKHCNVGQNIISMNIMKLFL